MAMMMGDFWMNSTPVATATNAAGAVGGALDPSGVGSEHDQLFFNQFELAARTADDLSAASASSPSGSFASPPSPFSSPFSLSPALGSGAFGLSPLAGTAGTLGAAAAGSSGSIYTDAASFSSPPDESFASLTSSPLAPAWPASYSASAPSDPNTIAGIDFSLELLNCPAFIEALAATESVPASSISPTMLISPLSHASTSASASPAPSPSSLAGLATASSSFTNDQVIISMLTSSDSDSASANASEHRARKRKRVEISNSSHSSHPASSSNDGGGSGGGKVSALSTATALASLSKEDLNRMTMAEFNEYQRSIEATHKLTADDRRTLSAQRRQIRNREYAQQTRQKRKVQSQELQGHLHSLQLENDRLKQENLDLRGKVSHLLAIIKRLRHDTTSSSAAAAAAATAAATTSVVSPTIATTAAGSLPPPAPLPLQSAGYSPLALMSGFFSVKNPLSPSQLTAAAGTCLLALLFSIGILFNLNASPVNSPQQYAAAVNPAYSTGRVMLESSDSHGFWLALARYLPSRFTAYLPPPDPLALDPPSPSPPPPDTCSSAHPSSAAAVATPEPQPLDKHHEQAQESKNDADEQQEQKQEEETPLQQQPEMADHLDDEDMHIAQPPNGIHFNHMLSFVHTHKHKRLA